MRRPVASRSLCFQPGARWAVGFFREKLTTPSSISLLDYRLGDLCRGENEIGRFPDGCRGFRAAPTERTEPRVVVNLSLRPCQPSMMVPGRIHCVGISQAMRHRD